ncbi:TPD1 protein homolog 1B-like [Oryza brachyantha]|uniref:TPD1 protein homolog 1B-like n=1 Tax=Oryza brachyantha TaxID=4533 RepID=UPI0003EA9828|nr:TPD1 protein homolog 1B-like [Oryza brachyantha]
MESKLQTIIAAFLLLFCLCSRSGEALCSLSDLVVTQAAVPGQVAGEPEYHVTVENRCICTQTDVRVSCAGFQYPMPVDPSVIRRDGGDGDLCILNGGGPVTNDRAVSFYYAGKTRVSFAPVSSTVDCS